MASKVEPVFDWSPYVVYVHGPGALSYMRMFNRYGLRGTDDIDKADIVCFTGGEDVSPGLYGEKNVKISGREISYCNPERDSQDATIFGYTLAAKKKMVGICRGGQFLNVMNGGTMWQHVDGHGVSNGHNLVDTITGEIVRVTSTHHQMMRPAADGLVIATARESSMKIADEDEWHVEHDAKDRPEEMKDIEVVWYEGTQCLCFQPHPEFGGAQECTEYFFNLLEGVVGAKS